MERGHTWSRNAYKDKKQSQQFSTAERTCHPNRSSGQIQTPGSIQGNPHGPPPLTPSKNRATSGDPSTGLEDRQANEMYRDFLNTGNVD